MAIEPQNRNGEARKPARDGISRSILEKIVTVVAVLGVAVFLIVLLVPGSGENWEAARRARCMSNLKQIALGLRQYADEHHAFPPAYTVDATGKPLHSWRTLILPYLDEKKLYETIDLSKPWDAPENAMAVSKALGVYTCPSMRTFNNETIYRAMVGPDACFLPTKPRRLEEITDPHDSTLAVIEGPLDEPIPWMAPIDADESLFQSLRTTPGSKHPGGANDAMVDGTVTFMKSDCPADVRHAFTTIAGNEAVRTDE